MNTKLLSGLAVATVLFFGCDTSTSSRNPAANTAVISGIVKMNGSGPTAKPLPNALIRIESPSGTLVKEVRTDTRGSFSAELPAGTYVINPQRVINSDSFVPPGKRTVTVAPNTPATATLYYWDPLTKP